MWQIRERILLPLESVPRSGPRLARRIRMSTVTRNADPLVSALDRLARFESTCPVISLYLDARPDSRGRDHYQPFVRKELAARQRTYPLRSPERQSFDRDVERIQRWLESSVQPSANAIAIFACAGESDFFEPIQLEAPLAENQISVSSAPQLFTLARLIDENPRYALAVTDTHSAQIHVFAFGFRVDERGVDTPTLPRTGGSGWSQMRYQRHVDELQKNHARELVERLERVVDEDRVERLILAGNEVSLPLVRRELSKRLEEMIVDSIHVDMHRPLAEIVREATQRLREHDAKTDAERVSRFLGAYRAGRLATGGVEEVRRALALGQADELLISATLDRSANEAERAAAAEMVSAARRTGAAVTFIEDPTLLEPVGGAGAFLRFRL
jgi:peptide subunit release factor 1 (eRF1)